MKNKRIYETLKTEFYSSVDKDSPFMVYPRPLLVRDSFLSLNGEWDFAVGRSEPESFSEKITVPYPPESLLSGINRQTEEGDTLFYKKIFDLPEGFKKKKIILHFGAVDTLSTVYLNGVLLGKHEGGYLPFSFDCTEAIKEKENVLRVFVVGDLSRTYPYGKKKKNRGGMWYTPTSGIWQTVWLESVPENYIKGLKIESDTERAVVNAVGAVDSAVLTLTESLESFKIEGERFTVVPKSIRLWSPEDPYLYSFVIESGEDRVSGYFALREIGIELIDGIQRLTLNKKPYLFNGLLDQGYYPDGILTPASPDAFEKDILVSKSLGFNVLRKHIKIEPEIFYHLCDKHGMIVFQDMVNNSGYSFFLDTVVPTIGIKRLPDNLRHRSKKTREIFKKHMIETMEHLYSFPSILYYTIFNEGWGQFSADKMYTLAKSVDKTRIIDATSGWFTRRLSDVDSRHIYFKPVKIKRKAKASDRPIVISEFGGYSHRVKGHLFGEDNYGYKIFSELEDFSRAFCELYEKLIPEIRKGISALIYTQVSDVEDETNGIMTYDRRVIKLDVQKVRSIMKKLSEEVQKTE